jgi:hypothetical protein
MEIKMLFNQIKIFGWNDIEPVILAALVSELPVLLIGDIGSNKTEGAEAISRALLGAKIDFRAYEVPALNFDGLIGFMNPKSLAKGELDFVHTPLSIWKADAVLFDEINRANPFIQSKLHELMRRRRLLGLTTSIKILFSAVNPPERYQSGYMDMALASRFACVPVPSITSMKEADVNQILSGNGNGHKRIDLKAVVDKARRCRIGENEMGKVQHLCRKVIRDLSDHQILFMPNDETASFTDLKHLKEQLPEMKIIALGCHENFEGVLVVRWDQFKPAKRRVSRDRPSSCLSLNGIKVFFVEIFVMEKLGSIRRTSATAIRASSHCPSKP